jgi:hypothetical protein
MNQMKKIAALIVLALISTLFIAANTTSVQATKNETVTQNIQITTNAQYDRDPSIFRASDLTYWLFFARGKTGGIRDGYNPDLDYYDIYYKTASSIYGLETASETAITLTPPDNAQRDIAALQTQDGIIRVFTSTGLGAGSERFIYQYTYDGSWHGPTAVPGTDYAAHISVLETGGKIWVFFDYGYSLFLVSYNETTLEWSSPILIANNATLAKAIVDEGTFYVVWTYVNEGANIWGSGIYLSSSSDGATWFSTEDPIAAWSAEGATNWDPALIKDRGTFRLFWAPDIGPGGQFLATTTSTTPMDESSWTTPVKLTTSSYEENSWWDFWPQPYSNGISYLFYTSERNAAGTERIDGNIWLMFNVLNYYLPLVQR